MGATVFTLSADHCADGPRTIRRTGARTALGNAPMVQTNVTLVGAKREPCQHRFGVNLV